MRIEISPLARADLRDVEAYLAERNPDAANRVLVRLGQVIDLLADYPEIAPVWRDGPTRAVLVSGLPYRIHYQVRPDAVRVVTVVHVRRKGP